MAKIRELVALCRKYWRWIVFVPLGLILAMQIYFFFQIAWWVHFNPGFDKLHAATIVRFAGKESQSEVAA